MQRKPVTKFSTPIGKEVKLTLFEDDMILYISSVHFSHSVMSDCLQPHEPQHSRPPCPSPTPRVYPNMSIESVMPSNHLILCHPFSSCLQSFPALGSFPMKQLFPSSSQSIIGASALASVLPMNSQGWFLLGLTCLISLLSKGLSRVFSNTTDQKHQFFGAKPSL